MHELLNSIAEQELSLILDRMPSDPIEKTVCFTEVLRVIDYWSVFQTILPEERRLHFYEFEMMKLGWNLAVEKLFVSLDHPGFPLLESTKETRQAAINLVTSLGRTVLIKIISSMVKNGLLLADHHNGEITIRAAESENTQLLDAVEFEHLRHMEEAINRSAAPIQNGWSIIKTDGELCPPEEPGCFYGVIDPGASDKFKIKDIDNAMSPLVFPWHSGKGIMMGYGASPDIDLHFFAIACEYCRQLSVDLGIHPKSSLDGISGSQIRSIVSLMTSLNMKHVKFATLAAKKHKEISIPQSLTIWGETKVLENSIAEYLHISHKLAVKCISAVSMTPTETVHLKGHTTFFMPQLFDFGNGTYIRPVSSLLKSPYSSFMDMQKWRNKNATNAFSAHREEWFRTELYAKFQGRRYITVNGNIKLRKDSRVLTDVDAAIYDKTNGELALFQLKWQDYYTNDIKSLRSKASNLVFELDNWSNSINAWLSAVSKEDIVKTFRLKVHPSGPGISRVYLFGLSRVAARMKSYGYEQKNLDLAVSNWPLFVRLRFEIGGTPSVFGDLHRRIQLEMREPRPQLTPIPFSMAMQNKKITVEDLFFTYEDISANTIAEPPLDNPKRS